MADNVAITAGSGTTVAADEVVDATLGTVKAQYVKVMDGTLDSTNKLTVTADGEVVTRKGKVPTFSGRVNTFRTPGRAGTSGQKIFSIHNATGSTKVVHVNMLAVDIVATVIKAVTVIPPIIRAYKVTVLPTNGSTLTKVPLDSNLSSSSSVTVLGDASADGTNSTTALTATLPSTILTQEFAPRFITAAGYEMFDRTVFFDGDTFITLRALEGIVLMLDYTTTGANPTTDNWIATCEWDEF